MNRTDLEINRDIRRVLVRHWIDLGQLSVRSTGGRVNVRGRLQRIEGRSEELTSSIVERIATEIRRIPGVGGVSIELANWTSGGGTWKPAGAAAEPPPAPPPCPGPENGRAEGPT